MYDFMAIGAHPDDVEISAGGTIAKMSAQGKKGVIVDLTDASMATNGTPSQRLEESKKSAECVGILARENLNLPDGYLQNDFDSQNKVIDVIRMYKPKIILTHSKCDDHPDHMVAHELVRASWFKAGLKKWETEISAFRPSRLFYFESVAITDFKPSFCVDISEYFQDKFTALRCYKSQFQKTNYSTDISSPAFFESLEVRNRFYGLRIKSKLAEAFQSEELAEVKDLTELNGLRFS